MKLKKNCLFCGKEFEKRVNESVNDWNNRHKFCSKSCNVKYHKPGINTRFKDGQKPINPIKKGEHRSLNTEFKKGMKLPQEWIEKMIGRVPRNKGKHFDQILGENHWNWKGGISDENHRERSCLEYKIWNREVLEKDNYTCQKCGARCGNGKKIILHAHHIQNFSQFPELRHIINNGITLCDDCHYEFHSKYGFMNNNQEQINNFLEMVLLSNKSGVGNHPHKNLRGKERSKIILN